MNSENTYQMLEDKMLKYSDLINVPVQATSEELTPIVKTDYLVTKPINSDMEPYTGSKIYVRKSVLQMLNKAAEILANKNPKLQLQVVYGYRALSIQKDLFLKHRKSLEAQFSGKELEEATHRQIAVPEIAGHPTGGAIDIQLISDGNPLDMGTKIWEFVRDSFTYSPFISEVARSNRKILRDILMEVGFAPFDGEWWHFSYGDKEWAKYYGKPAAIYEQIEFRELSKE